MPHQCIECGRTFSDGSKEMLSGCPDCGGNKFQFRPGGRSELSADPTPSTEESSAGVSASSEASAPSETDTLDPTDTTDTSEPPDTTDTSDPAGPSVSPTTTEPPADPSVTADSTDGTEPASDRPDDTAEDTAQASARSDVVTPDELDRASRESEPSHSEDATEPRPDIDELRDELNEQFESIRIVSPGTYELNLMELYDRQEYIISLQEDGRYVIEMPDAWGVDEE